MANKKQKKMWWIVLIVIGIIFLKFFNKQAKEELELQAYIVDKDGNIIKEADILSIISPIYSGTGYDRVDNVNTFLAIGSTLNNAGGNSEITISTVVGNNPCVPGNAHPNCPTLVNKYGPAIDYKYTSLLPMILPPGETDIQRLSDGMVISSLEVGNVNFTLEITGAYKDSVGSDVSFTKVGSIALEIQSEKCNDGTTDTAYADFNSADADFQLACSNSTTSRGKYCRVNITGSSQLTDNAGYCGCCRPEGGGTGCGKTVTGSVCV